MPDRPTDAQIRSEFRAMLARDRDASAAKRAWLDANPDGRVLSDPTIVRALISAGWAICETWRIADSVYVALRMEDD